MNRDSARQLRWAMLLAMSLAMSLAMLLAAWGGVPGRGAERRTRDITFDDLKFEMKKGDLFQRSMLTDKIERLHGERIRIRGFLLPSFQSSGITQFVLVRDNLECCFGPGAALYDCILVEMAPGKSTAFTVRPVAVEGIFNIKPLLGPGGKHLAIYRMEGWSVK